MSKIKILSENLANQIAAGEVVERPASVVKEFVENAIDAKASHITVQIEGAGTKLIRVIDDGEGMDHDDVLLCLERHATSKLANEEQLSAINTLGFRGEAIPSIASVSRFTIISQPPGATLGTMADIRFGRVSKVHESGCNSGTTMEVRDLFGNVPARKKFLKSAKTELFHIEEAVKNYGLAYHDLGITYKVNGRDVFHWPSAADTLSSRIKRVYNLSKNVLLIPVDNPADKYDESERFQIHGYLLPPDQPSASSARLRIFVNGRAVKDRMIAAAVTEGLHNFLMKGRKASGVIFISIDPAEIDVNVHPTKQEIRFRRHNKIYQLIVLAVSHAMQQYQNELKFAVFGAPEQTRGLEEKKLPPRNSPDTSFWEGDNTTAKVVTQEPSSLFSVVSPSQRSSDSSEETKLFADKEYKEKGRQSQLGAIAPPKTADTPATHNFSSGQASSVEEPEYGIAGEVFKPIGQFLNSYIVCEHDNNLVVIDQHAAHERLLFEELKKQFSEQEIPSQSLLFPKIYEGNPSEMQILRQHGEEISALGVKIQDFGGNSYIIKGIPAMMSGLATDEILSGIFEQYAGGSDGGKSTARRRENILATMACKAAIKAGQSLQPPEIEKLMEDMHKADIFSHCPHGRPVVKSFSIDEIKKWFHRT